VLRRCGTIVGVLGFLLVACGSKTGLKVAPCDPDAGPCCTPAAEICNGLDDDCDGAIDDGIACFTLDGRSIQPVPSVGCGAGWYRYDVPDSQSANPAPDIRRSGGVVIAIQAGAECDGAHIAVIADLPQDGSGGQLDADFQITPATAGGIEIGDEPGECSYDAAFGSGRCKWVWQPCCTDGVLLGKFNQDACVRLTLSGAVGVSNPVVLDGASGAVPQSFGSTLEICSQIRPEVP
jgi:hypothetical protein